MINFFAVNGHAVKQASGKTATNMSATDLTKQFGDFLNDALQNVAEQQQQLEALQQAFIRGELEDPHTLMIAAEKASLGLELTVQLRNKAIEAYQEIMRMQI